MAPAKARVLSMTKTYSLIASSGRSHQEQLGMDVFRQNSHKIVIPRGCDFIDFSREVIQF
jgi:hypothetical protein